MFTELDIFQYIEFIFKVCQANESKKEAYLKFIEPFLNQLIVDKNAAKAAWKYKNDYRISLEAMPIIAEGDWLVNCTHHIKILKTVYLLPF